MSWFGGKAVREPGEETPTYKGKPMFPLLQINCQELPYRPLQLEGTALLVLYLNSEEIPFDKPNGDGWLIREYQSLDGLSPFAAAKPERLKPFPIKWLLSEPERPGWEEAWGVVDLKAINESQEASKAFFERYPNHHGTKVGGYPSEIQHGIGGDSPFVFQVGSEEKPNWMWADNGIGYFCKSAEGEWEFQCQFY